MSTCSASISTPAIIRTRTSSSAHPVKCGCRTFFSGSFPTPRCTSPRNSGRISRGKICSKPWRISEDATGATGRLNKLYERFGDGIGEEFAARGEDKVAVCFAEQAEVDELAALVRPGFKFLGRDAAARPQSEG